MQQAQGVCIPRQRYSTDSREDLGKLAQEFNKEVQQLKYKVYGQILECEET